MTTKTTNTQQFLTASKSALVRTASRARGLLSWRTCALLVGAGLLCDGAIAADFDLPAVNVPGVSGNSDPVDIFVAIFKFIIKIVLWLAAIIGGLILVKNTAKSINKVRREEDGKWGDVVGEVVGNVIVVIAIIAFATWITGMIQ